MALAWAANRASSSDEFAFLDGYSPRWSDTRVIHQTQEPWLTQRTWIFSGKAAAGVLPAFRRLTSVQRGWEIDDSHSGKYVTFDRDGFWASYSTAEWGGSIEWDHGPKMLPGDCKLMSQGDRSYFERFCDMFARFFHLG